MKKNRISHFYTKDLAIRASAVITTDLVKEIQHIHQSLPIATIAMGRLLTGSLLIAGGLAEKQQVSIRFQGAGPLGQLSADASFESEARCYATNPTLELPLTDGKLSIGAAVGPGILTITRFHEFHKHPQVSIVEIQTGEIAEDLSYYYQQSHQIPCLVSLSVSLDKNCEVTAAGGVILELMPGAPASVITALENKVSSARPLSEMILGGATPWDLIKEYSHSENMTETLHLHDIKYHCPCSPERVERTLGLLGGAVLAEMILKGAPSEAKCHFCGRTYWVSLETLRKLHDEVQPD
ncbi:MAG: Hsp33 family molecular chaperone HslO [Deltaproteobacteria bacterium]|nr:Hsp33 family molecular chaperone HslO [Deltaproteobacteria bacterium]